MCKKGYKQTENHKKQMGAYILGKTYEEVYGREGADRKKEKLSKAKKGKRYPKISIALRGRTGTFTGHYHSVSTKEKIRKGHLGKKLSIETKGKISEKLRGAKSYLWKGGISKEPYGQKFNNNLKEQIRKRDKYRCQECFRHQDELYTKTGRNYKLLIHHIDYNKRNNEVDNLISLCRNCHLQTNWEREDWTTYFKQKIICLE